MNLNRNWIPIVCLSTFILSASPVYAASPLPMPKLPPLQELSFDNFNVESLVSGLPQVYLDKRDPLANTPNPLPQPASPQQLQLQIDQLKQSSAPLSFADVNSFSKSAMSLTSPDKAQIDSGLSQTNLQALFSNAKGNATGSAASLGVSNGTSKGTSHSIETSSTSTGISDFFSSLFTKIGTNLGISNRTS